MTRERVTFAHPAWRPFCGCPDIVVRAFTIIGERTAFGLVVHLRLGIGGERYGYWDVSDPLTGGLVAQGKVPGRIGAIAALVQKAVPYQHTPGGFRAALQIARQKLLRDPRVVPDNEAVPQ